MAAELWRRHRQGADGDSAAGCTATSSSASSPSSPTCWCSPRLDPKELERLRSAQLNVLKSSLRSENDEGLSKVALDALLYAGHPYRHPKCGTVQAVQALTLEEVKAQRARVFTRDRLVVGAGRPGRRRAAGAGEGAARAAARARRALRRPPSSTPASAGKTVIVQRDTLSTAGYFGARFNLARSDPDYFAVALGLSYLGEHRQQHGVLFTGAAREARAQLRHLRLRRSTTSKRAARCRRSNVDRSEQDVDDLAAPGGAEERRLRHPRGALLPRPGARQAAPPRALRDGEGLPPRGDPALGADRRAPARLGDRRPAVRHATTSSTTTAPPSPGSPPSRCRPR